MSLELIFQAQTGDRERDDGRRVLHIANVRVALHVLRPAVVARLTVAREDLGLRRTRDDEHLFAVWRVGNVVDLRDAERDPRELRERKQECTRVRFSRSQSHSPLCAPFTRRGVIGKQKMTRARDSCQPAPSS